MYVCMRENGRISRTPVTTHCTMFKAVVVRIVYITWAIALHWVGAIHFVVS